MLNVIIPVLNRLDLTQQVLQECKNLGCEHKIIIINNGSTDGTKEWLDEEYNKDSRLNLIHLEKNIGVNPAWNLGVRESDGEYLLIINNDILIPQDLGKHLIEAHEGGITCPLIDNGDGPEDFKQNINGTCFLIKREDYLSIPEELVIFFGDDWLYRKLGVKFIDDMVFHLGSQTVLYNDTVQAIWESDQEAWKRILKEENWKDLRFNQ